MKSLKGKHLIWYDIYKNNTYEDNITYLKSLMDKSRKTPVICLNTLEVFDSVTKAAKLLDNNKHGNNIINHCKGKTKHAYKHPITNEKLYWRYYDEYQTYSDEEKQRLVDQYYTCSFLIQKETN